MFLSENSAFSAALMLADGVVTTVGSGFESSPHRCLAV